MNRRHGTGGFSLIELLVVISIIAVLISLLLPALGRAHEQARRLKCSTQVRQVGDVMHVYANGSRDWLPMMPVPAGLPLAANQWRYGGVAGLFSLRQSGDGSSGYSGAYADGGDEPLLGSYLSSLEVLTCPSDREDRYYGQPYSPAGALSYAASLFKRPQRPHRSEEAISYNISYAYIAGFRLSRGGGAVPVWGEETNGPDLGPHAGYGAGTAPPGGSTPNSSAAGAAAAGKFAPGDNHRSEGGNVGSTDGSGRWVQSWWASTASSGERYVID